LREAQNRVNEGIGRSFPLVAGSGRLIDLDTGRDPFRGGFLPGDGLPGDADFALDCETIQWLIIAVALRILPPVDQQ
jgi:hypothetical protein